MPKLFESTRLNSITLANRFVRSATWEGMAADDGSCTPALIDVACQLARGGVGLIITGHAFVSEDGRATPWQMGVCRDELIPGLAEMARTVHEAGGRIVMQIAHAGCHAATKLTGLQPMGPSAFESAAGVLSKEMTHTDVDRVCQAFAHAARRAREAGFDGVQLHAAHGYLLSQFLSPFYNKRTDAYGGTIQNRARIAVEALKAIRATVGNDFSVLAKVNSEDFLDGGLTVDDMLQASSMLEQAGIDAIEMSGGTVNPAGLSASRKGKLESESHEVFYREAARQFKQRVRVPLMLVGGIRSYAVAELLLTEGLTDYIAMCRPFIREPDLVNRWKSGDLRRAFCVSDNGCFRPAFQGRGIACVVKEKEKV